MIEITENAAKALHETMSSEGKDPKSEFLRVAVQGGGCSGLSYKLDWDDEMREGDEVYSQGDLRLVVDNKSMLFLHGLTLDYSGGLNGKGFVFNNPNATGTCGCGESFKV